MSENIRKPTFWRQDMFCTLLYWFSEDTKRVPDCSNIEIEHDSWQISGKNRNIMLGNTLNLHSSRLKQIEANHMVVNTMRETMLVPQKVDVRCLIRIKT